MGHMSKIQMETETNPEGFIALLVVFLLVVVFVAQSGLLAGGMGSQSDVPKSRAGEIETQMREPSGLQARL